MVCVLSQLYALAFFLQEKIATSFHRNFLLVLSLVDFKKLVLLMDRRLTGN